MRIFSSTAALILTLAISAPSFTASAEKYQNPVINNDAPDPTVLRDDDGVYYLYSTEYGHKLPIYRSEDLVNWVPVGSAFTKEGWPKMVPGGGVWAPEIRKIGDTYYLYYSKSKWGGEWECGIGVATAKSPTGPFTDHGKLFISKEIGVQNSIDQFYWEENGKKYLFWGSFHGINGIELAPDGLSIAKGAKPIQIAGTLTEGTCLVKKDGYYYLIGSAGSCCEGLKSTYRVVVARSKDLFGPYVDREGKPAMENNFSLIMKGNSAVHGPGHNSILVQDDAGDYWMIYHGFDAKQPEAGRKAYLDKIVWDKEGWPTIAGEQPSAEATAPVINKKK